MREEEGRSGGEGKEGGGRRRKRSGGEGKEGGGRRRKRKWRGLVRGGEGEGEGGRGGEEKEEKEAEEEEEEEGGKKGERTEKVVRKGRERVATNGEACNHAHNFLTVT